MFKLSKNSLKNREGVDGRLIEICDLALSVTSIDFGIPSLGGLRTVDEQYQLFCAKASSLDGTKRISRHQFGMALDFFAFVDGKASWDKEHLAIVACAFLQSASVLNYKLKWGGLWKNVDMPHVQLEI